MALACVCWLETRSDCSQTGERIYLFCICRGDEVLPESVLQIEKLLKGKGRLLRCSVARFQRIRGSWRVADETCCTMSLTRDKWREGKNNSQEES